MSLELKPASWLVDKTFTMVVLISGNRMGGNTAICAVFSATPWVVVKADSKPALRVSNWLVVNSSNSVGLRLAICVVFRAANWVWPRVAI